MDFPTLYAPTGSPYAAIASADSQGGGGSTYGQSNRQKPNGKDSGFNPFQDPPTDLLNPWIGTGWTYQQETAHYLYVMTPPLHQSEVAQHSAATPARRPSNPFQVAG